MTAATTDGTLEAMLKFLRSVTAPEQIVELRALKVSDSYGRPHTESGFFDRDNLDTMARAAIDLTKRAKGVYFTLNPIQPDLLARRCNRVARAEEGELTKDANIFWRRWLLLDVDPVRDPLISANDDEKASALSTIMEVREHLRSLGWADPIFGDSGNGYHLLYRIDMPSDDSGLVSQVLNVLAAQFNRGRAKVDTTVFNPARICKIPGTWARKGDSTPNRPHRQSRILEYPVTLEIVPAEMLKALAPAVVEEPKKEHSPQGSATNGRWDSRLKVDEWLRDHGIVFRKKPQQDEQGRTVYVLEACPFDPSHRKPDACIMQDRFGKLSAKCFHNSCSGRGWKDFKKAIGTPAGHHYDPPLTGQSRQRVDEAPRHNETLMQQRQSDGSEVCLTDLGNGQRFARAHGAISRYCHPWSKWLLWDGTRWRIEDDGRSKLLAKRVIADLYEWAKSQIDLLARDDSDEGKARLKKIKATLAWALKSQSAPRINALLDLARSEPGIPILPEQLDINPWALNCLNGTLNLQTGTLRQHNPADYLTKLAPVVFDPQMTCPRFEQFLLEIFDDAESLVAYLQRLVGYWLTGDTTELILPVLYGVGANGKSVLIVILFALLGQDYSGKASRDLLIISKSERHPTALAWLHGKRFVAAVETAEGARLDEALVKELTGKDPLSVRRMREDFWGFDPTHKLVLVTNHKPRVRGTDHAIWRRLRLIPFEVIFDEDRQDKQLAEKLKAELPGIPNWALSGCLVWQQHGLQDPPEVIEATKEYRSEEDSISSFIAEKCLQGPDYRTEAATLYSAYAKWCEEAKERELSKRRFCEELRTKGFDDYTNNGLWFRGIAINGTTE